LNTNPFGQTISIEDIVDTLGFFDAWEERYKYIIDLGKELPVLDEKYKNDDYIVRGCQSQVWLSCTHEDGKLWFDADSDAFIVKGLLGVVLAAYNGKTPQEILDFDIDGYFAKLGLLNHLSSTRSNGIKAMVKRVQSLAGTGS